MKRTLPVYTAFKDPKEKYKIGDKIEISHGSGVDSGKKGTILDWSSIKTDGRGVPQLQGEYHVLDAKRKSETFPIKLDSGEIILMYKNRIRLERPHVQSNQVKSFTDNLPEFASGDVYEVTENDPYKRGPPTKHFTMISPSKFGGKDFYSYRSDDKGNVLPELANNGRNAVFHSNMFMYDPQFKKVGHKDLEQKQFESFKWALTGNESIDMHAMPNLDARYSLFVKYATPELKKVYDKQEDWNYHSENAEMVNDFATWMAEGGDAEAFVNPMESVEGGLVDEWDDVLVEVEKKAGKAKCDEIVQLIEDGKINEANAEIKHVLDTAVTSSLIDTLDPMTRHYLVTALWSSTDESTPQGGEPMDANYDLEDIDDETVQQAIKDCADFQEKAGALLDGLDMETVGHDFWLTRNGHGAGFWDGDYEEEVGKKLTTLSKEFGEVYLYVGDADEDGNSKIYSALENEILAAAEMPLLKVLDNGGETFDRYTVLIENPDGGVSLYGMSANPLSPQGFNQYVGDIGSVEEADWGDQEVDFETLSENVKQAIKQRQQVGEDEVLPTDDGETVEGGFANSEGPLSDELMMIGSDLAVKFRSMIDAAGDEFLAKHGMQRDTEVLRSEKHGVSGVYKALRNLISESLDWQGIPAGGADQWVDLALEATSSAPSEAAAAQSFKFRAECLTDVERFMGIAGDKVTDMNIHKPNKMPDVVVTFKSDMDLNQLKSLLGQVVDGHVMLETIQPEGSYTGNRTQGAAEKDQDLLKLLLEKGLSNTLAEMTILIAKGLSNKEVANQMLGIDEAYTSEEKVKQALSEIYAKLNVKSRAQLIVWCLPHLGFTQSSVQASAENYNKLRAVLEKNLDVAIQNSGNAINRNVPLYIGSEKHIDNLMWDIGSELPEMKEN